MLSDAPSPRAESIVVGRIPVLECLRARKRRARKLYYLEAARGLEEIVDRAEVPAEACDRQTLDDLTQGVAHQGVALIADPLPLEKLKDWLTTKAQPDSVVLVLDGVEDPHNFGAIVRSASAFGVGAVIFGRDRAAPISAASVKAAAGAMEWIDLVQEPNLARALEQLKEDGFWSYALDAAGDRVIWDTDLRGRVALVVGSEGEGIRRLVLERSDFKVRIPLSGPITSLNASVSAAIAMAECVRQRRAETAG